MLTLALVVAPRCGQPNGGVQQFVRVQRDEGGGGWSEEVLFGVRS
jgi:hypothetical protein